MKGEEKKRKIKNKKWDWNEGGNVGEIKKEGEGDGRMMQGDTK